MRLPERVVALHEALAAARIPHAIGGAIALAYSTDEPRGTRDIDVNVFVEVDRAADVLAALPDGVAAGPDAAAKIARDGQIRLWWDDTPVDLFFDYDPIHAQARRHARTVPYEGTTIPVLAAVELAVFKSVFDRSRDWADIEDMVRSRALDVDAVRSALRELFEPDDERFARLDEAARRGSSHAEPTP